MALPYEGLSEPDRIHERAARGRQRETWARKTDEEAMRYELAVYIASERETMEDQLVRLLALPAGDMRTEMLTVVR